MKKTIIASVVLCFTNQAFAATMNGGPLSIGPYASVSSTKAIKPNSKANTSEETVTQRTTYGVKIDFRLGRFFGLGINGGTNKVNTSKKAVAMRDEYDDIDFSKDLNVDPAGQSATYRYIEEQRLAVATVNFEPKLASFLWFKAGAGVRARQRLISSSNELTGVSSSITDPIKYHAVANAGLKVKLLRAFTGSIEYKFYFLKFPKTEPHEQEALISFGVSI